MDLGERKAGKPHCRFGFVTQCQSAKIHVIRPFVEFVIQKRLSVTDGIGRIDPNQPLQATLHCVRGQAWDYRSHLRQSISLKHH